MPASILIPTRGRPAYLDVTLASVMPQADRAGAEVLVIDDGRAPATGAVAEQHGARVISTGGGRGANAARNRGVRESVGDPVIFIDDDIHAPDGWLQRLLDGVDANPDHEAFGGPIRAALQGGGPRSCGREGAPITTLHLGTEDCDAELVWSANMAVRRDALRRIGDFDETIEGRGEEEEWERRLTAAGGRMRYLAEAGLDHRRSGADARLPRLTRASFTLGRTARRLDLRKGTAPGITGEIRTVLGCAGHVIRYRCPNMIAVGAHAVGRLREAISGEPA